MHRGRLRATAQQADFTGHLGLLAILVAVDVTDDDEAGQLTVSFGDLQVGKKEFTYPKSSTNAVRRIVMRALPVNSSARDLVNLMK